MDRVILHCDLNNFFVSASCLSRPELRQKPVAVCGDASKRHGIILAKNQAAKRMGVKTAQAIWQARSLCPDLVTLKPDYPLYMALSDTVRDIYGRYTGHIEPFGIDECWLDVTPYTQSGGFGRRIAEDIRKTVKYETGLTISVGVSWNKIFSKLGSDYKKPDAVTVIDRENYGRIIWPLPVRDLLSVGRSTRNKLELAGINTIGDLAGAPLPLLRSLLGKNGETLHAFAAGQDMSPVKSVEHHDTARGIGNSMTTKHDLRSDDEVREAFLILSEMVARRARAKRLQGRVVAIYLRDNKLEHITRQVTLKRDTFISDEIAYHAMILYQNNWDAHLRPIRSIGVRITRLSPIDRCVQLCFFDMRRVSPQSLEFAKDDIIGRFGPDAIIRASLLHTVVHDRHPKEVHDVHPLSYFLS
ncbi:MAG: DNA polymerase IV [Eubacteriales bacterium]|nr:DNA polymerase IV [Eubacteriales bacterium]